MSVGSLPSIVMSGNLGHVQCSLPDLLINDHICNINCYMTRKCCSIGASDGELYIGSSVLLKFIGMVVTIAQWMSAIQNCLCTLLHSTTMLQSFLEYFPRIICLDFCMHGIRRHIPLGRYLGTRRNI